MMLTILLTNIISAIIKSFSIANSHIAIQEINYPIKISIEDKNSLLCTNNPNLGENLLSVGRRMGIKIVHGIPEIKNKDATYKAVYGELGTITFLPKPMSELSKCKLISHEFIHVLQHLKGNLKGVEQLGWEIPKGSLEKYGSAQEAEAYTYQNQAGKVFILLKEYQNKYKALSN